MRKFYIFNINKEMTILSYNNPHNLYLTLERLYKMNKKDISIVSDIYNQIVDPIKKNKISKVIYNNYKENVYYQNHLYKHTYYNKYRPEDTSLAIYNTYILLKTNVIKPSFLETLSKYNNFLLCDFENRDYFWTNDIKCFNKLV